MLSLLDWHLEMWCLANYDCLFPSSSYNCFTIYCAIMCFKTASFVNVQPTHAKTTAQSRVVSTKYHTVYVDRTMLKYTSNAFPASSAIKTYAVHVIHLAM